MKPITALFTSVPKSGPAVVEFGNGTAKPNDAGPTDVPAFQPQAVTSSDNDQQRDAAAPAPAPTVEPSDKPRSRRWSIQHLIRSSQKHSPTAAEPRERRKTTAIAASARASQVPKLSASDRRARHNALVVRSIIVGPDGVTLPTSQPAINRHELRKAKAVLLQPRSANKVIANLRALPPADAPASAAPIHAVCLPFTEAQAEEQQFSRLKEYTITEETEVRTRELDARPPTVASATLESVSDALRDLNLVSLVNSPDFGLGHPGDGNGILSGALPSAEAIVGGVVQITPQLMSLGYATGRAIVPNHSGVYPPTDRMSVLTYWWGLELVLPPPTLAYLSQAQSISSTVMNFLSALALLNGGVREIMPFVRYIAQFVDFEFTAIKKQDLGKGVVCAATWIMPAAMVPRPWDFPSPPPKPTAQPHQSTAPVPNPSATLQEPIQTTNGSGATTENTQPEQPAAPDAPASAITPSAVKASM